jgi:hypothetical protein
VSLDEPLPFRGARGLIKHAYRTAAEVERFLITIDRKTKRGMLTGFVASSDPFLLQQRPLVFVVRAWRWPVEGVTLTGDQVRAQLGPLMERE